MSLPFDSLNGIENIYCPDKSCDSNRDWLVHEPNQPALWTLASIMLLVGLYSIARSRESNSVIYGNRSAQGISILLAISMMLRAGLAHVNGDKTTMYMVSIVFNYFCGFELANIFIIYELSLRYNPVDQDFTFVSMSWVPQCLLYCFEFSMTVTGVYLMFHPYNEGSADLGSRLLIIELNVFNFLVVFIDILDFIRFCRNNIPTRNYLASQIIYSMTIIWTIYMSIRMASDLNSKVRDSETMFLMLNYLPIIVGCLAIQGIGEPNKPDTPEHRDAYDLPERVVAW